MKKRFSILQLVTVIVIVAVVTFNLTFTVMNVNHNKQTSSLLTESGFLGSLLTVDEIVKQHFPGEVDNDVLKAAVIRGYLEGIGDKYSTYMTAAEYEEYNSELNGKTVGIGINYIYDTVNKCIEIIEVASGSPAEAAGVLTGDMILAVDGQRVSDIGYYAAIDMINGESGTTVSLTLLRNGEEQEVSSLRTPLEVITVKYHVFSGDSSVGVIRISAFYSKTPMEVKAAVETLKGLGCTKFIFDVRYNGGGEKNSIVNTLDYILPEGKLLDVVYKGSAGTKTYRSDESHLDAKVAVLINNSTASAAELFAAALRDFTDAGKFDATLVGTTTYGKGVFQTIFELSDGSAFKVSCGRYDPPSGVNYDGIGVEPDVFAELSEESKKINFYKLTDENDDQLILAASILSSK